MVCRGLKRHGGGVWASKHLSNGMEVMNVMSWLELNVNDWNSSLLLRPFCVFDPRANSFQRARSEIDCIYLPYLNLYSTSLFCFQAILTWIANAKCRNPISLPVRFLEAKAVKYAIWKENGEVMCWCWQVLFQLRLGWNFHAPENILQLQDSMGNLPIPLSGLFLQYLTSSCT